VNMTAWMMRDEHGWTYQFPQFVLPPGSTVRVATGCGANTADALYWCFDGATAVWNNDGDIVHLHDAGGVPITMFKY